MFHAVFGEGIDVSFAATGTGANIIFAEIPKEWNKPLQEKSPYYIIDESTNMIRLVTSYDTTKDEVEEFTGTIRSLV